MELPLRDAVIKQFEFDLNVGKASYVRSQTELRNEYDRLLSSGQNAQTAARNAAEHVGGFQMVSLLEANLRGKAIQEFLASQLQTGSEAETKVIPIKPAVASASTSKETRQNFQWVSQVVADQLVGEKVEELKKKQPPLSEDMLRAAVEALANDERVLQEFANRLPESIKSLNYPERNVDLAEALRIARVDVKESLALHSGVSGDFAQKITEFAKNEALRQMRARFKSESGNGRDPVRGFNALRDKMEDLEVQIEKVLPKDLRDQVLVNPAKTDLPTEQLKQIRAKYGEGLRHRDGNRDNGFSVGLDISEGVRQAEYAFAVELKGRFPNVPEIQDLPGPNCPAAISGGIWKALKFWRKKGA